MESYIVHPTPDTVKAFKAFLKALKIDFEKATGYSPEFEEKMRRADEDKKAGRGFAMSIDELNALWK